MLTPSWKNYTKCAFRYYFWRKEQGVKGLSLQKGMSIAKSNKTKGRSAALVDIVAAEGTEWVRVSTLSEKRLLFDLAKLGWQNDSDSDVEENEDMADASATNWEDDDDEDQVDIVKNARDLARAAHANPIRGHSPKVRFVLTRIYSGKVKEVDTVLDKMRATGIEVQCANDIPPTPSLSSVLPNLLPRNRPHSLSSTLNLDCTILLALISDISHTQCPVLDWYPSEVRAQIADEEKEQLCPTHLYPAISDHPMVRPYSTQKDPTPLRPNFANSTATPGMHRRSRRPNEPHSRHPSHRPRKNPRKHPPRPTHPRLHPLLFPPNRVANPLRPHPPHQRPVPGPHRTQQSRHSDAKAARRREVSGY
jgi:hypothetical protein